ncbi:hypothetical protein BZG73_10700 [Salinivibrio siamensis]|uniref:DUF3899 domain-containing protein n=1 Tax=Salinivibrio siamensis TaxID=414286 RepID=A0ABX3K7I1_9GAMM|nr:hypothetical protein [Salinivibrio siamensis]OOE83848.1 hypothetical protein BZG73_10700 [Salinivibrio siamensis]
MNYECENNKIDLTSKIIRLIFQFFVSAGVLVVLFYCGRIGYYPTGLTVGDGLIFVAVALSFGFTYSMVVFMLYCTSIALTPLWRFLSKIFIALEKARRRFANNPDEVTINKFRELKGDRISMAVLGTLGLLIMTRTAFIDLDLFYGLFFLFFLSRT